MAKVSETGLLTHGLEKCCGRITIAVQDRYELITVRRNSPVNGTYLRQQQAHAVRNTLHENVLCARKPLYAFPCN